MSEPKTSIRRMEAVEKQRKAMEMRLAGKSYETIASELEYASKSGAYKAVMSAIKKTLQEPADELRKVEAERLDAMLAVLWDKKDKPLYVDRILRIMERRARLLGLDAPTRQDITSDDKPIPISIIEVIKTYREAGADE